MTDTEFAAWLRTVPRELSPEQVDQIGHDHDAERGPYIPHTGTHHTAGEAGH